MPVMDGPRRPPRSPPAVPDVRVIALTSFIDQESVEKALDAGAISYLLKDARPEALTQAIRDAVDGRGTIDSSVMRALMERRQDDVGEDLTAREREVLALARGRPQQQGDRRNGSRSAWAPSACTSATSSPSSAPPTAPRPPPSR